MLKPMIILNLLKALYLIIAFFKCCLKTQLSLVIQVVLQIFLSLFFLLKICWKHVRKVDSHKQHLVKTLFTVLSTRIEHIKPITTGQGQALLSDFYRNEPRANIQNK